MTREEYEKIMEEIKKYQFSVDVPELTDSEPGIEHMEVISINDMFNILKVIEINENALCQIHPCQEEMDKLTPQDCIKWIRSLNVTANGEDVMRYKVEELLEKGIDYTPEIEGWNNAVGYSVGICKCGEHGLRSIWEYCPYCGQKLDWYWSE